MQTIFVMLKCRTQTYRYQLWRGVGGLTSFMCFKFPGQSSPLDHTSLVTSSPLPASLPVFQIATLHVRIKTIGTNSLIVCCIFQSIIPLLIS